MQPAGYRGLGATQLAVAVVGMCAALRVDEFCEFACEGGHVQAWRPAVLSWLSTPHTNTKNHLPGHALPAGASLC